jgi:hypothetical protein
MEQSFGRHFQNRGQDTATIVSLFKEAALYIEHKESRTSLAAREATADRNADHDNRRLLFLHAECHPKGIPRQTIRQLYNRTFAKTRMFDGLIVIKKSPTFFVFTSLLIQHISPPPIPHILGCN